jgi:hypothetical protein
MLQSLHNFRIYQSLVAKCIKEKNELMLINEKNEDVIALIVKRRAEIKKRHEEIVERMKKIIEQSKELLQKQH